ncbi:hypothetical protein A5642_22540 [Mycolicibacterium mucogenicum]|uniref:Uncharacterized protein n=1 Tax=Mycolicibacterium mucogenicum TaxID=56689 RepID=A0A1A0MM12_MYCMU|nr:hypothetical protein [Mycolicibacterium mucogenicum]OBA86519.1 hypothetical protein A5642_22540 [Mycolicibacterium mucogenicum]
MKKIAVSTSMLLAARKGLMRIPGVSAAIADYEARSDAMERNRLTELDSWPESIPARHSVQLTPTGVLVS